MAQSLLGHGACTIPASGGRAAEALDYRIYDRLARRRGEQAWMTNVAHPHKPVRCPETVIRFCSVAPAESPPLQYRTSVARPVLAGSMLLRVMVSALPGTMNS